MEWNELKILAARRETARVTAVGVHEAGGVPVLDVVYGDVPGIIPAARAALPEGDSRLHLTDLIGQSFDAVIVGYEEGVFAADRALALERIAARTPLEAGTVVKGTVRHVGKDTVWIEAQGRLIPVRAEEAVRRRVPTLRVVFAPGEERDVLVKSVDPLEGSIVAAEPNPYEKDIYRPGSILQASVVSLLDGGVILSFEPGVTAFAPLPRRPVGLGDTVVAVIRNVDAGKGRMTASILRKTGTRMPLEALFHRKH
ncbi:MAG: hypothetical protein KM312_04945 [Hydrogenibacillus schlegelii]|uniref:S1 motif domain-containing protein n=1 Tax=Hydrogenibacillus schlegelii TaxID=1484 RepID=A0A947CVR8_HYDSH|nr:hypothetical protein [Hydrogenibacillus schlegelii]